MLLDVKFSENKKGGNKTTPLSLGLWCHRITGTWVVDWISISDEVWHFRHSNTHIQTEKAAVMCTVCLKQQHYRVDIMQLNELCSIFLFVSTNWPWGSTVLPLLFFFPFLMTWFFQAESVGIQTLAQEDFIFYKWSHRGQLLTVWSPENWSRCMWSAKRLLYRFKQINLCKSKEPNAFWNYRGGAAVRTWWLQTHWKGKVWEQVLHTFSRNLLWLFFFLVFQLTKQTKDRAFRNLSIATKATANRA